MRAAFLLPLLLAACAPAVPTMPPVPRTADGRIQPRPATEAEIDAALAAADDVQAIVPAQQARNLLGGLDPTGIANKAVDIETQRRTQALMNHMPAIMQNAAYQAELYCADPANREPCEELRRLQEEARAARR